MFSHIQVSSDGTLLIYANQRGSARTASFARGTITLDIIGGTLQFKNYELLPIPKGVSYLPGDDLFSGLGGRARLPSKTEPPDQDSGQDGGGNAAARRS